jgi:archaemetzincin
LPPEAFVQIKSPRYRADSLLRFLLKVKPDTVDYMMGLTSHDISTTKRDKGGRMLKPESKYRDWGVFGLGFRPGYSCVISTYRIHHEDSRKYMDRLIKICIHEFGHNVGLHHCPTPGCVMQDAVETIKTVDTGSRELCSWCRNIIVHR